MQQFPLSFQFNECFLHALFVHSYSSQYGKGKDCEVYFILLFLVNYYFTIIIYYAVGNFLFDTPKERVVHKLKDRTQSLW